METTPFSQEAPPPPPPPLPPPVITPPAPKPRKNRGWMIFAIVVCVLLVFSLFGNFAQFIAHALSLNGAFHGDGFGVVREAGPRLEEWLLKNNHAPNKIAVVTVDGIISSHNYDQAGNSMVDVIRAEFDRAARDRSVKAVVLKVDSPGGEVMASDQIYHIIKNFQIEHHKPVICSMGSLAASGGYYISSPCRWIVANPLTITGSIGVIMEAFNYRGLMDKIGVRPNIYKSGKYKDMLSGMRETNEIPPEEHAMVQGLIDETYQKFKSVVADGRAWAHEKNKPEGHALAEDWTNYADGRVLSGEQALRLGFVDQLGDFDDAVKRAQDIANGGQKANLIEYRERYDFSDFFSMFGQGGKAHDLKLDLGLDAPRLQAGQLYFLYLPMAD
jgi:protease-4